MTNERTLLRDIYVTLADAKTAREANIHNDEGAAVLHSFFQLFGPRIREALGCEDFAAVRAWKPDEPTVTQLHNRPEVMNPPQSAAEGCEAGNLNTGQRHGLGASPRATEARPADVAPLPEFGDPCPTCASGKIGQSGYNFRCANCGWLGPLVPWTPR